MTFVKYLDLVVLALALPIFLLAGWPMLGYAAGAVAWLAQRAIQSYTNAKAMASSEPRAVAGWVTGSMIGRGWLVALTIFAAGMVENDAGLAAAILVIVLFTVYFTVNMILRPFEQPHVEQPSLMRARLLVLLTPVLFALAAPSSALALDINEDYKPQNEFKLDPWIQIDVGPIDMSINKAVAYVLGTCLLTIFLMLHIAKRMQQKPGRLQAVVEGYYGLIENITKGNMDGPMIRRWFPFLATVFLFIWFSNMLGYLPLPTNTEHKVDIFGLAVPSLALYAATANISVPLVLTLIVVFSYHFEGIKAKGPINYLKGWIPAGVEGPARAPIFLIEVISHGVRLVSLSVRLFANILAGHLLILFMGGGLVVLLNLAVVGSLVLGVITGAMAVAFFLFEVGLVATLQAFIFTTLAAIYLGGAVAEEH